MPESSESDGETFGWRECAARLGALLTEGALEPEGRGAFVRRDGAGHVVVRFRPPAVLSAPSASVEAFARSLPAADAGHDALGLQGVILVQAGAAAVGLWSGEDLVDHKAFKRYVVRGKGKAQPTHLATKGKSRYGSRLRLQNHRRLLEEVGARVGSWWDGGSGPTRCFRGAPQRLWSELLPLLPEALADAESLRTTVRVPDFEELRRIRRWMLRGRIERFR